MLETAIAQLCFIISVLLGQSFALWSLERIIEAMIATRREYGKLNFEAVELLQGPQLDETEQRDFHLRRFRAQAIRAARETPYYGKLFESLGLDPAQLSLDDIHRLPITSPTNLQANLNEFVCRSSRPSLHVYTVDQDGPLTPLYFSRYELHLINILTTIDLLLKGEIQPDDVIHVSYPQRATLLNLILGSVYTRLGALVHQVEPTTPAHSLSLLTKMQAIPGKKSRPSVLSVYPSYLGELVECGLQLGYSSTDFGLERIVTTGEIVTDGLKMRCQRLFGPVEFRDHYIRSAILPVVGTSGPEGNLEFETLPGLVEIINPETASPAQPGEFGTIVVTPFRPYRDTTLLLRYDTQDIVQCLDSSSMTSPLGKFHHSVHHNHSWTFPRQVQEALEAVDEVPLPARYGFWATSNGIAVEVLVGRQTADAYRQIEAGLIEQGIPIDELYLVEDICQLQRPIALRCDL